MATDSMVAGLFQDPQQYQQAMLQQQMKQNYDIAGLSPEQQVTGGLRNAGSQIGGAVAGLMGVQDPQMQLMAMRKQVLQGLDRNDPKSLAEGAQALNQAGDAQGAQALFQAAQTRVKDLQDAEVKQSQIVRNLRERPERAAAQTELGKLQAERAALVEEFGASDPRVKEINALIAKKTTAGGIGSEIAAGLSPLVGAMAASQAKNAGAAAGTEVGKQTANVQGKYTALGSIKDAVDMLDKGIFSGGYGPAQELAAKYAGGLIRKDRLANTQEFRAYIGDVVIPRLQEFGGNDSVEELKYLRSVMAGDTSMEGTAIKNILLRADKKIRSGIDRLEQQQKAVTTGKPLPLGDTSVAAPKATKRFNPVTGKLEAIQ
jgi:hypothetical protein